ncbi:MAG: NYN domain-containing protein [Cyanobacteria bacterium P01_A01_bin.105]
MSVNFTDVDSMAASARGLSAALPLGPAVEDLPLNRYGSPQASKRRSALLVDGSHLFYAAAQLNIEVDYLRLLQALTQRHSLLRAYFYTGVDPHNDRQRGFLSWLSRNGYRVISKPLAQSPEGGRRTNLQVEMAVDMLVLADHCHTITLLSGDGALAYAAERLTRQGTRVELVGLLSMTSDALVELADTYTDLADLQTAIQKLSPLKNGPKLGASKAPKAN